MSRDGKNGYRASPSTHPGTIDFANYSILNLIAENINWEKVSILRIRLEVQNTSVGAKRGLTTSFIISKVRKLKRSEEAFKDRRKKKTKEKHLEKVEEIKEDQRYS